MTTMRWIRAALVGAVALVVPAATAQGAPVCGTWEVVEAANTSDGNTSLEAIAAADASNAWAVGTYRKDGLANPSPLVMRWNGSDWSMEAVADLGFLGEDVALEGIAVTPEGSPIVAGHYRDAQSGLSAPLILRARGGFWQAATVTLATEARGALLRDVASGRAGAWAVGEATSPADGSTSPFVVRDDGSGWREVPVEGPGAGRLVAVAVAEETDVWAVGHDIVRPQFAPEITVATVYRWNGKTWSRSAHPAARPGTLLDDVVAIAADDVWAVGRDGASGLFLHWDGAAWTEHASPANGAPISVAAAASDDVWAVGAKEHYHFDGAGWTAYPAANRPFESDRRGIAVAGPCQMWTVGSYAEGARSLPFFERMREANAPEPPSAPVGISAVAVAHDQARVEWTAGAGNVIGYVVERCVGDAAACAFEGNRDAFDPIMKMLAPVTAHVDSPLKPETYYTYRVRAFNDAGLSAPSDVATIRTPAQDPSSPGPVPVPPSPESDPVPAPAPIPQSPEADPGPVPAPLPPSAETVPVSRPAPEADPGPAPAPPADPGPAPMPPSDPGPVPTLPSPESDDVPEAGRVPSGAEPGPLTTGSRPQGTPPIYVPVPLPPAEVETGCAAAAAEIVVAPGARRAGGAAVLEIVLRDAGGARVDAAGCVPVQWAVKGDGRILETHRTALAVTLQGRPGTFLVAATAANGVSAQATITLY